MELFAYQYGQSMGGWVCVCSMYIVAVDLDPVEPRLHSVLGRLSSSLKPHSENIRWNQCMSYDQQDREILQNMIDLHAGWSTSEPRHVF